MNTILVNKQRVSPSKIVCIGRNYAAHAAELGNEVPDEMVVFIKPNSAIGDTLSCRHQGEDLHYETELCFLVDDGQLSAVGVGLDLTKRQTQSRLKEKRLPWERSKAFDGSAVFSEFVSFSGALSSLRLELTIDKQLTQQGGVPQMLFAPDQMLGELNSFLSFESGDVLMTGTPEGVGVVRSGAEFVASVFSDQTRLATVSWTAH